MISPVLLVAGAVVASMLAGSGPAGAALRIGGSGSREAATEMKRSRIAQMTAAAAPTTPTTLARVFMVPGSYPAQPGSSLTDP